MTARLPLAVIGAGLIGLRHARAAMHHADVFLTAVVETNPQVRDQLRAEGLPACAMVDDVPADTRAAVVATPTPAHLPAALQALSRGWAVLVEKPLTGRLDQADALLAAAHKAGVPVFTGHHRRAHPFVDETRRLLPQLGDLAGVQGLWCLRKHDGYFDTSWRRAPGAGPLLTNLSHEIDLLRLFCGEIATVTASASSAKRGGPLEDTVSLTFCFENGALGSFLLSDAGASPWAFEAASGENPNIGRTGADCLRLIGTRGALSFPSLTLWRNPTDRETEWSRPLVAMPPLPLPQVDPLSEQLGRFARAVATGAETGLASGQDGRAVLAATLAAALSAERGTPVAPGDVPAPYPGWTETSPSRRTATR